MKTTIIFFCAALVLMTNLASALPRREARPQLYPNKHLAEVGESQANRDIQDCSTAAAGYVHNARQPGQGARRVIGGAAKGAVVGTIGGAVMGNTGRGAAAGSVMGATKSAAGAIREQGTNNPAFQQYVEACLEEKGYKVLGWS